MVGTQRFTSDQCGAQSGGASPPLTPLAPGLGPTFSSSRSRMRTSTGLFPGSRSTFLCRDHLHMPGPGERGRPGGGGSSQRRPL